MYAVIETGGKQYAVSPGDEIRVEKLDGAVGDPVRFDTVLAVSGDDGSLTAGGGSGAAVAGTICDQGRARKIDVLKFKRRKMYRRHIGHRQPFTQVKIESIDVQSADNTEL